MRRALGMDMKPRSGYPFVESIGMGLEDGDQFGVRGKCWKDDMYTYKRCGPDLRT